MWATTDGTETGPRVQFGNGQTQRFDTLTCDCPISRQVTTTTTVSTTGTTITVTTSTRRDTEHRPPHAARVTMTRTKRS